MFKKFIALFFLCSLFACNERGKQVAELPAVKNDTFDSYNEEYDIPIPIGFSVDTIEESDKKTDYSKTLICPRLTGTTFNGLNKILRNEIERKAVLSYTDTTDEPVDPAKEVFGVTQEDTPIKMYKNENLVSYGFLSMFSDTGAMRPFRKYFTVNYDLRKSKFIFFNDYFFILSPSDSAFFKRLVFGNVGNPDVSWYSLSNSINFSVDQENVYFYYDMFGEFGNPMGLVYRFKKKYLNKFIKDEYR
jgi:hypothetical protein